MPAPTRAIYCATKSAQLRLFEAVSIECRAQHELTRRTATEADGLVAPRSHVRCVAICPATVRTAFRNSAVDGPADQVVDAAWTKGKKGSDILEPEQVADQAILAVDRNVEGTLFTQVKYGLAPLLRMFV